jgi:NAD(P)H dehydrogenase (quinone)
MGILVILAHPDPNSFNHAIARMAVETLQANGHEVIYHDLCGEQFDPFLRAEEIPMDATLDSTVERHCEELAMAEGIVIVHPNWWGQPPAIMKGWIDRVFRPGVAYQFLEGDSGEGVPIGLLKAEAALVFNTANTPEERELSVFGDPLERLWRDCVFELCGVHEYYRKMFGMIVTSSPEERKAWLAEVRRAVEHYFQIK